MVPPAITGTGFGVFVTERSAVSATSVLTVTLLFAEFGSAVVDETESVCGRLVPFATAAPTLTTKVKFAVVFAAIATVSVHLRVASTHVHPAGPVSDTAVVPAGSVSLKTGAFAVAWPALVTVCVYVMLFPAVTGFGLEVFVTLKSACVPEETGMVTLAELLGAYVSRVAVPTVTVSLITVPPTVPAVTRYTAVTVPVAPGGTLALVQDTGDVFGQTHVPPPALTTATETKVELFGAGSDRVPVRQLLGPRLVTICV